MAEMLLRIINYPITFLLLFYVFDSFRLLKGGTTEEMRLRGYKRQKVLLLVICTVYFLLLYFYLEDIQMLYLYFLTLLFCVLLPFIYRTCYMGASEIMCNHVIFLFISGMLLLSRISTDKAFRQVEIGLAGLVLSSGIPYLIYKFKGTFRNWKWVYFAVGVVALAAVFLFGSYSNGAKISISLFGVYIQPLEFVKISFVFFMAAFLRDCHDLKSYMQVSVLAAIHVIILALSKDLGGALILFVIYLVLLFVATEKWYVLPAGLGFVLLMYVFANLFFTHVHARIEAWLDPLSVIDNQGYQVSQSLFGIGTWGWFGSGLGLGMPETIPVVVQDFLFSAIGEELGVLYALCLILICFGFVLLLFNLTLKMKDSFYRMVALGLTTCYGFQTFLTIGGCIKFIPSTGVALPFVSYGGSSLLASILIFSILQGLSMTENKKESQHEKEKRRKK